MSRIRPLGGLLARSGHRVRKRVGHGFAAFARAVRSRYGRAPGRSGAGDRFFLQARRAAAAVVHRHRWFLSRGSPRFGLRLRLHLASPGLLAAAAEDRGSHQNRPQPPLPAPAARLAERNTPDARGLPARFGGRLAAAAGVAPVRAPLVALAGHGREQQEPTAAVRDEIGRPSKRLGRREDPRLATVTAALRRPPAVAAVAASRRQEDGWPPPRGTRRPSAGAVGTSAPAQLDLQAVTSQVMRQIDRRLVAWRERTGRA